MQHCFHDHFFFLQNLSQGKNIEQKGDGRRGRERERAYAFLVIFAVLQHKQPYAIPMLPHIQLFRKPQNYIVLRQPQNAMQSEREPPL